MTVESHRLRPSGAVGYGAASVASSILKLLAFAILLLLARKAFIDIDLRNYDSLAYHMPFAARLAGITPREAFTFLDHLEACYDGFPLLAELLQGLLWRLFGLPQAANLLALLSLVAYCFFVKRTFQVPGHVTFLSLVAVPLIQIHATTSLVDLPANLSVSAMLLLCWRFLERPVAPARGETGAFVLAAGLAANMKTLHFGIVGLALLVAFVHFLAGRARDQDPGIRRRFAEAALVVTLASPIVFAVALKNTVVHGNPVFPVGIRILGRDHPGRYTPSATHPAYLAGVPQAGRWLLSVAEYRAFDERRPFRWTGEQGNLPDGAPADRMGGYFSLYVFLNLLLLGVMVRYSGSPSGRTTAIFFGLLTIVTAVHPQSHELRYYSYWMIFLVTLNAALIRGARGDRPQPFALEGFGLACAAIVIAVVGLTRAAYVWPGTQPIFLSYVKAIEPEIRAAVDRGTGLCVVGAPKMLFVYSEAFHAPWSYATKSARSANECGTMTVVTAR